MITDELKHNDTAMKFMEVVVLIKKITERQEAGDTAVSLYGPQTTYFNRVSMMMDAGALLTSESASTLEGRHSKWLYIKEHGRYKHEDLHPGAKHSCCPTSIICPIAVLMCVFYTSQS